MIDFKNMKKYNTGLYIDSFQPLHNGHVIVINTMLDNCEKSVICIENDPKSTLPWNITTRLEMFERVFGNNLIIIVLPIPALRYEDKWRTKLTKITDIFRRIYPSDPEVFFGNSKEQAYSYSSFMLSEECIQDITNEIVRKAIKNNTPPVETLVPLELIPIIYRDIDINGL